ncbi:MAG: pyruvate, phosphate dikinase [Bdellovibrionaceae bacterium]|nr:pyruvate, phosphate dikinase [Pseudobdellovibrionaceae bacterium]
MSQPKKFIYFFSQNETDGRADMKDLLGGKGANLAEMTSMGLPVPPGFTISTEICHSFYENKKSLPNWAMDGVLANVKKLEHVIGKKFGDVKNPLLVSVRSGARASMPGMMDTILNLGLNEEVVLGLASTSGDARFAWDSYRRFIQMYANVVMGMNHSLLDILFEDKKAEKGVERDIDLTAEDLQWVVSAYKRAIRDSLGLEFPNDPIAQLKGAIEAVFSSWHNNRAITYRRLHGIPENWGTAVNVQAMVFGNMGMDCATGVAFTRDPSTGEKHFFGEYLINAQGEDVVAGLRTPHPISKRQAGDSGLSSLEEEMPEIYKELTEIYQKLEQHYRDMQDIEFTIEKNRLWMLQTRNGKRTANAAIRIAMEMIDEKLIDEKTALKRVNPASLDQLLHPRLDPKAKKTILAKGLPASPGGVCGRAVFSSDDAVHWKEKGEKVILVRIETSPEDIEGMVAALGILTTRGGMTSHAAVVARGMGKCCVAGCGDIHVDYRLKEFRAQGYVVREGDMITLDGSTGEVFLGEVKTIEPTLGGSFGRLMEVADKYRKLGVRTNADTPHDSQVARDFGAEGIGLCRTEHMFFATDRIDWIRKMIVAEGLNERKQALDHLLPMQREDFYQIFKIMDGLPVTIRLLDPPLHEFLPHDEEEVQEISKRLNISSEDLRRKIKSLQEFNPMLGHRGCRLAITYPEIYEMQAQAIAEAAAHIVKDGKKLTPEIMIPLVAVDTELEILRELVVKTVERVKKEQGVSFDYLVGTMIELPRAAVTADEIAKHADFFSFGTNDLTQTALGLSRDDSAKFLKTYVSEGIYETDPFMSIDVKGVGALVKMGVDLGRQSRTNLKVGICGEHGGDPASILFFAKAGLDYVSCSPFRVPIARLAAAQAALN